MKLLRCRGRALSLDDTDLDMAPLVLLTPDEVLEQVEVFRKRLGLPATAPDADDCDAEESEALMAWLCAFGTHSESAPRALSTRQVACLADRVRRVRAALRAARTAVDAEGALTGCLLPADWGQRLAYLFGRGVVPLAWVRMLDALRF